MSASHQALSTSMVIGALLINSFLASNRCSAVVPNSILANLIRT